jgi:putative ABC transport system ATP-binding protein
MTDLQKTPPIVSAHAVGKQVTTSAGELTILSDVSFEIAAGESVAVVGVSGSGKSTLLGLLAGLDLPSHGWIRLADQCLNDLDEDGRTRVRSENAGFVFQSFQLLPSLTALENVMLPLELATTAGAQQQAEQLLERVGLSARADHYPRQLSGGEQQRVAIARAFAMSPPILFADEPTGNLDTTTGQKVIELLFDLNAEQGTTLILVTHDEKLAGRCSRSIRLDAGRVVSDEHTA